MGDQVEVEVTDHADSIDISTSGIFLMIPSPVFVFRGIMTKLIFHHFSKETNANKQIKKKTFRYRPDHLSDKSEYR